MKYLLTLKVTIEDNSLTAISLMYESSKNVYSMYQLIQFSVHQ